MDSVVFAVRGEIFGPPEFAERHAELTDEHAMQKAHWRRRTRRKDLHRERVRRHRGDMGIPQVLAYLLGMGEARCPDIPGDLRWLRGRPPGDYG